MHSSWLFSAMVMWLQQSRSASRDLHCNTRQYLEKVMIIQCYFSVLCLIDDAELTLRTTNGGHRARFFWVIKASKAKIKGVLAGHNCCYGNLMCQNIYSNMFNNEWAVFWYHDFSINWYRVLTMTHQNLSLGKYWKLFQATLIKQLWS